MNLIELLKQESEKIKTEIHILLGYSEIIYDPTYKTYVQGIELPGLIGKHIWKELPLEGKQLQSKLNEIHQIYTSKIKLFLRSLPTYPYSEAMSEADYIKHIILQDLFPDHYSMDIIMEQIDKSFKFINNSLKTIYTYSSNSILLVVDANALLYNTMIDKWGFADFDKFIIVLTPTLISELDDIKTNQRKTQELRTKARTIINQINEYDRRGDILKSVNVFDNKIFIMSEPLEPNFQYTLSFLNPNIKDDRYVATALEIMRKHNASQVYLVTADFNLKQKCRMSSVPVLLPPEPIEKN